MNYADSLLNIKGNRESLRMEVIASDSENWLEVVEPDCNGLIKNSEWQPIHPGFTSLYALRG